MTLILTQVKGIQNLEYISFKTPLSKHILKAAIQIPNLYNSDKYQVSKM